MHVIFAYVCVYVMLPHSFLPADPPGHLMRVCMYVRGERFNLTMDSSIQALMDVSTAEIPSAFSRLSMGW